MSKPFKPKRRELDEEQEHYGKAARVREQQEREERQIQRALRNKDYASLLKEDNDLG